MSSNQMDITKNLEEAGIIPESPKKRSPARFLWLLLPIALIAIVTWRFIFQAPEEAAVEAAAPVIVSVPSRGSLEQSVSFPGNLRAEAMTTVVPKVSGRIEQMLVEEGQVVRDGQLLAVIEDDIVRLQMEGAKAAFDAASAQLQKVMQAVRPEELESARASLAQAEEDLENARNNLDRTRRLYEAGTVAKSKFEEAENQFKSAETEIENAQRSLTIMEEGARAEDIAMARANSEGARGQLEMAMLQLSYAEIAAPVDGTVIRVHSDPGNMTGPGTPLISIMSTGTVFADVAVPEKFYSRFIGREGSLQAMVDVSAYPEREPFEGRVTNIASFIDAASRTFTVEVLVEDLAGLLKPGMFVNIEFIVQETDNTLIVPSTAVLFRDREQVVFLYDDSTGTVVMVPVETGLTSDGMVEIISGLADDAPIIVEGNAFLEAGQRVKVLESK